MTQENYAENDPLSMVVNYLEKANKDQLASDVIDVFASSAQGLEQFNLIAKLYHDVRNNDKAVKYAEKVLGLAQSQEEIYNARANLGKLFNNINEPEKSLFHSKLNLIVTPGDPDTLMEMVFSLYLLNKKDQAEKILRELKSREHELHERHQDIVNFNLGTYDLEQGNFNQGLRGFMIKGKKLKLWFSHRELPYKFWSGGAFPGKTLILFAEGGGIGDEMLSVRFMDDLKQIGFDPVYYTSRQDLCDIFNRCGYKTIMNLDNVPADAMWTYFMQVPIYLESTPESVMRSHYLYPSDAARERWSWVKQSQKLRVGVRWQGNSKNERDLHRKVPLAAVMEMLRETLGHHAVEYYSLQIGDGEEDARQVIDLIDVSDKISSYDDTLALLENLDFVVTSCTSVLHASAIVGTKTLALIPVSAYFTWVSPAPDNTSIWYPDNLRLFRQTTPKQWTEPLREMSDYIRNHIIDG